MAVGILSAATVIPLIGDILNGILKVDGTTEWFLKVARAAERVLIALTLSPMIVGWVYRYFGRIRHRNGRLLGAMVGSASITLMAVVAYAVTRDVLIMRGTLAGATIPLIVAACPPYPSASSKGQSSAGRRFKARSRVTRRATSA